MSNSFYCVECIHHTLAILPTSHNFWLIFANQLWADQFGTWLIAKLFYSVHKKLRTCGADFKYYKVSDLRLRIQDSWNVVADLRLRTKLLNVQLRTCRCGLRKLKIGCGFADCGLKKKTCGAQHCQSASQWHQACYFLSGTILAWEGTIFVWKGRAPKWPPVAPGLGQLHKTRLWLALSFLTQLF